MDTVTIEMANAAFEAAKNQADAAYKAGKEAEAAKARLTDLEQKEIAKAQEYGVPADKLQGIIEKKAAKARNEANKAARIANDEAHKLRLLHYELDRIRTITDLMKLCPGAD